MTTALVLISSEPHPLRVGHAVRPSAAWRRRYSDAWLYHWRSGGPGQAPSAWTGTIAAFFTDRDSQRCAVITHSPEDCGCNFNPECWRCEGDGIATRRALPLEEIEAV